MQSKELVESNDNISGLSSEELVKIFSVLTHDLRSPLFAIEGFTTLLSDEISDQINADAADYLERIQSSSKQMKTTIEGMNTIVKLLSRKRERVEMELGQIAEQVKFRMKARAEEAGVQLNLEPGEWGRVFADPEMLETVLCELVANAITFHHESDGNRTVTLKTNKPGTVEVHDNGPGVATEYQDQIFDPGIQLDKGAAVGSGYGLFASKRIAELHDGELLYSSPGGNGSILTLRLPVAAE